MRLRWLTGASVVLLAFAGAPSSMLPTCRWYTLETPNFRVHFPEGWEELARDVAGRAEDARGKVVELVGTDPGKVDVVLNPYADFSNGYAALFPTHIGLFPTFPQGKWAGTRGDWLSMLVTHEYTHIAHMHTAEGLTWVLKKIFGEVGLLPNMMVPMWLTEGLAVYSETVNTDGGRGRNPYFEMKFRTPILEGRPWKYDQIGHYGKVHPPPDRPYVGGYYMMREIVREFGEEAPSSLVHEHSIFPLFPIDWDLTVYKGRPGWSIWRDAVAKVAGSVSRPPGRRLTCGKDVFYHRPTWSRDGRWIYAYRTGYDLVPALVRIDVGSGREEVVLEEDLTTGGSFGVSGDRLYFAKLRPHPLDDSRMISDIYELRSGRVRRLTRGLRAWSPTLSPDGRRVLFLRNEGVYNGLWVVGPDGGSPRELIKVERMAFSSPCWSPDGRWIALSGNLRGYQDIYLVSSDGSGMESLFLDEAGDFDPCWSPDGRYIVFCSDRTGVHDIYAYDLGARKLYRLTDLSTGAFEPSVSPDGRVIAYTAYTTEGTHIYLLEWDDALWEEVAIPRTTLPPSRREVEVAGRVRPYEGLRQLRPTFWIPVPGEDEKGATLGMYTASWDVVGRHTVALLGSWGLESGRLGYQVAYLRRVGYPILGLYLQDWTEGSKGLLEEPDSLYWSRDRGLRVSVEVPIFLEAGARQVGGKVQIGVAFGSTRCLELPEGYEGAMPVEGSYVGSFGELSFWDVKMCYRDLVPSRSRGLELGWSSSGGDVRASEFHGTLTWNLPLGPPHGVFRMMFAFGLRSEGSPFEGYVPIPRGYDDVATRAALVTLEYDLPLLYVDRGPAGFPLFLEGISGAAFWDLGTEGRSSFGAELRAHTVLFYRFPLYAGVGVVRRSDGELRSYPVLGVGYPGGPEMGHGTLVRKLTKFLGRYGRL